MKLKYKDYFPINDSKELRETSYSGLNEMQQKKWRNFKIITRSNFIKNKLLENQSNNCPICSKTLINKKTVIHHVDYKQLCNFKEVHRINVPTEKKPFRIINIPKCDLCFSYEKCLKKVYLIHTSCHFILHKMEGRIEKTELEKTNYLNREKKYKLNKEEWINNSSTLTINLINRLLSFINKNSESTKFYLRYNIRYISLKPNRIIHFKPNGNNLLIGVSSGHLDKWHEQLIQKKIEVKIRLKFKKTHTIYYSFDVNYYNKYEELILNILKDAINTNEKD